MWGWLLLVAVALLIFAPRAFAVLVVVAIVGAGALFLWMQHEHEEQERAEAAAARTIRPDELDFEDLQLSQGGSVPKITGRVRNRSVHKLVGFTLQVTVQDCVPKEKCGEPRAADCRCDVIYNKGMDSLVSVPPGEARDFKVYLEDMYGARFRGSSSWSYRLNSIQGTVAGR
jgi:hypothetical protein